MGDWRRRLCCGTVLAAALIMAAPLHALSPSPQDEENAAATALGEAGGGEVVSIDWVDDIEERTPHFSVKILTDSGQIVTIQIEQD